MWVSKSETRRCSEKTAACKISDEFLDNVLQWNPFSIKLRVESIQFCYKQTLSQMFYQKVFQNPLNTATYEMSLEKYKDFQSSPVQNFFKQACKHSEQLSPYSFRCWKLEKTEYTWKALVVPNREVDFSSYSVASFRSPISKFNNLNLFWCQHFGVISFLLLFNRCLLMYSITST